MNHKVKLGQAIFFLNHDLSFFFFFFMLILLDLEHVWLDQFNNNKKNLNKSIEFYQINIFIG